MRMQAHVMMNKFMKSDDSSYKSVEVIAGQGFSTFSAKGNNLVKIHFRVMALGENADLVMIKLSKCVKFDDCSFDSLEVMAQSDDNTSTFFL